MTAEKRRIYSLVDENIKTVSAQAVYRLLEGMGLNDEEIKNIASEFFVDDHEFWMIYDDVEQTLQMPDSSQDENRENNNDGDGEDDDSNGPINPGNSDKKGKENKNKGTRCV